MIAFTSVGLLGLLTRAKYRHATAPNKGASCGAPSLIGGLKVTQQARFALQQSLVD